MRSRRVLHTNLKKEASRDLFVAILWLLGWLQSKIHLVNSRTEIEQSAPTKLDHSHEIIVGHSIKIKDFNLDGFRLCFHQEPQFEKRRVPDGLQCLVDMWRLVRFTSELHCKVRIRRSHSSKHCGILGCQACPSADLDRDVSKGRGDRRHLRHTSQILWNLQNP